MTEPDTLAAGGETVVRRSSRDPEQFRDALQSWLADRLPAGAAPAVLACEQSAANGQSSETVLLDAEWEEHGRRDRHRLVARMAPSPDDVPVFPHYDLPLQAETIRTVAAHSTVPVPHVHWVEPDAVPVGSPFFVMERVDGDVPPDVLPYTFGDNWLHDASATQRATLQQAAVGLLVALHGIDDPETRFAGLRPPVPGERALDRRLEQARRWYAYVAEDSGRSPLLDRTLGWLEDHLPAHPGPTVLSWGDARIGNVMWRDFAPVAVLDWEMATLGPPELDLGWLVYSHRVFQDLAESMGLSGMPDLLQPADAAAAYEAMAGYTPRHLEWAMTFAALQWGIVFLRTGVRQVHFGERGPVTDVDELLYNRPSLQAMLSGDHRI